MNPEDYLELLNKNGIIDECKSEEPFSLEAADLEKEEINLLNTPLDRYEIYFVKSELQIPYAIRIAAMIDKRFSTDQQQFIVRGLLKLSDNFNNNHEDIVNELFTRDSLVDLRPQSAWWPWRGKPLDWGSNAVGAVGWTCGSSKLL